MSTIVMALVVPAAMRPLGDAISQQLGHAPPGASTYVCAAVPAAGPADAEPTHYGCSTAAMAGFALMVQIAKTGVVPDGTDETLVATALGLRQLQPTFFESLIVRQCTVDDYSSCLDALLAEHGLQRHFVDLP